MLFGAFLQKFLRKALPERPSTIASLLGLALLSLSVPNIEPVNAQDFFAGFVFLVDLGHNELFQSRARNVPIQKITLLLVTF